MKKHIKINVLFFLMMFTITFLSCGYFFVAQVDKGQKEIASAAGDGIHGGAYYIGEGSTLTLEEGSRISGKSGEEGGAIYVAGTLIIEGGVIDNCNSPAGGAIYIADTG